MKNKKTHKQTQEFVRIFKTTLSIFEEIQNSTSINKSHIMDLAKLHKENAYLFDQALEQTYLKIFKCFHQKANRKIPGKFQNVAEMLFKEIVKDNTQDSKSSINSFCDLIREGIFSSIMNVRIMTSRILFLVLKSMPSIPAIDATLTQKVQKNVSQAVLFLIRTKVSTYRQLGIKLCSFVLYMNSQFKESIQDEMFKLLATEDNEAIRKMVVTNIPITPSNIERLLVRLRDKNPEIKATILRRLQTQNVKLQKLKLNNLYKLLYDGYGTKDVICKQQTLRYFASYFNQKQKERENKMKMETQQQTQFNNFEKFGKFIELFQPNLLLINSHLYILFDKLISELLSILPLRTMSEYVLKLCKYVKSCLKDKITNLSNELIWLKNSSDSRLDNKQINNVFEEYSPSGTQLAQLLMIFFQNKNVFAMNQFLQMFTNIKMPDQIGRNKMFDTLKTILTKLTPFDLQYNLQEIPKNDDICNVQTKEQVKLKKFMLSYYDIPIIQNSCDLIFPIVSAMKSLRPDSYSMQLQETISDWQDPQNDLFRQKSSIQLTMKRLESNNESENNQKTKIHYNTLKQKLNIINEQVEFIKHKTVISITTLSKIQHDWAIDVYMPLIKHQLSKKDQSYGILMLGLYCLGGLDKVQLFIPLFWRHIMQIAPENKTSQEYQQYKLNLLISLKLMTDFIIKFNILNCQQIMNNTSTAQSSMINDDAFMDKITQLILNRDSDIRIFSIECLCRMIYYSKVDQNNISTYFLYLLLLWWQTSNEQVSAKSVHTISLFFRSYIQKGNEQVKKLAEMLCIFHKILKIFQEKNKTINKNLIVYNLKINEFIKKTVSIATTVLKYNKQKKTIWQYQQVQLGPQQFFLLYLLYEPGFQNMLQKPVYICDFYEKCPLQTLIFVKKRLQNFKDQVQNDNFFPNNYKGDTNVTKKSLQQINRFEAEIQNRIQVKNLTQFNQQSVNGLEKVFNEACKFVNQQARRIAKNIEQEQIFINIDSQEQEDSLQNEDTDSENGEQIEDDNEVSQMMSVSQSQSSRSRKLKQNQSKLFETSHPPSRAPVSRVQQNNAKKLTSKMLSQIQSQKQPVSQQQSSESQSQLQQKKSGPVQDKPKLQNKRQANNRKRNPGNMTINAKNSSSQQEQKIVNRSRQKQKQKKNPIKDIKKNKKQEESQSQSQSQQPQEEQNNLSSSNKDEEVLAKSYNTKSNSRESRNNLYPNSYKNKLLSKSANIKTQTKSLTASNLKSQVKTQQPPKNNNKKTKPQSSQPNSNNINTKSNTTDNRSKNPTTNNPPVQQKQRQTRSRRPIY